MRVTTVSTFADTNVVGCNVESLDLSAVEKAMQIEVQTQISYWDALIVAAALLSGCDTLHTEGPQHGQVFEGLLTIVNPFLPKQ